MFRVDRQRQECDTGDWTMPGPGRRKFRNEGEGHSATADRARQFVGASALAIRGAYQSRPRFIFEAFLVTFLLSVPLMIGNFGLISFGRCSERHRPVDVRPVEPPVWFDRTIVRISPPRPHVRSLWKG